jgi:hypothetical protein
MNRRTKLRLILSLLLLGFVMSPAIADETTIVLDQQTPYVDVPVEATEPTTLTVYTTTGTPQSNPGFIDSWIELWQGTTKLAADDDGFYSPTNILASIITRPIDTGLYFIRATSFAYMCCNQSPNGTYLLTWNGVTTIPTATPTATPSPQPTVEPTPTNEPTPSATPEPTEVSPTPTPTIEPTPTLEPIPQPEPVVDNEPILVVETPLPTPEPIIEEEVVQEQEPIEQIVEEETTQTPIIEPELSVEELQEQIDAEYIDENTIELAVPTALAEIPGVAELFAASEAIMNVGSDMTQEQREESQSVVVGAIIITQIASMASISVSQSSTRKSNK